MLLYNRIYSMIILTIIMLGISGKRQSCGQSELAWMKILDHARSERLREKVEGRWFSARHKWMTHSPFLTVRTTVHQFKTITSYSQILKANVTGTGWETEKKSWIEASLALVADFIFNLSFKCQRKKRMCVQMLDYGWVFALFSVFCFGWLKSHG